MTLIDYDKEPFCDFLVYGDFTEPTKGGNAIVVRRPAGRVPWSKKIAPAIQRLVKGWGEKVEWGVEGEQTRYVHERRLWDTDVFARYEWDGTQLVPRPKV